MIWRRLSGYNIVGFLLIAGLMGMAGCANGPYIKRSVKGPLIRDVLTKGTSQGVIKGGQFTKRGWQPGEEGSLTYNLPAMPQGIISLDITGLSRTAADTLFLTLFEEPAMEYVDPYIINNPYLITLTAKNFQNAPDSPFDFLWTIKNFPAGTANRDRYVAGLLTEDSGYEQTLPSSAMPIFPDKTYTVQIEWVYGEARLIVNGEVLAVHTYAPLLFNTGNLRLVIGKSPIAPSFRLGDVTISNVWISYPTIYRGGLK